MTDRELLERAAKAAGMWDSKNDCIDIPWNPLTDDGDALRLAVKLGLTINPYKEGVFVSRYEGEETVAEPFEVMGQPDAPATRRAVVRAAAQIGSHE